MKYFIKMLCGANATIRIGRYELYTYSDGGMAFRQDKTGLMSPTESASLAGFKRLLKWVDQEEDDTAKR